MDEDWTFADGDRDSVFLNTVMIGMTESKDNEFHAYLLKSARGNTTVKARQTAEKIHFNLVQKGQFTCTSFSILCDASG